MLEGTNLSFRKEGMKPGILSNISVQLYGAIGFIYPHLDSQGRAKILRKNDLASTYIGGTLEVSPQLRFLNKLRVGIGVYTLPDYENLNAAFNFKNPAAVSSFKDKALAFGENLLTGATE